MEASRAATELGNIPPRIRELDFPDTGVISNPKHGFEVSRTEDHGSMPFSLNQFLILNGTDFAG